MKKLSLLLLLILATSTGLWAIPACQGLGQGTYQDLINSNQGGGCQIFDKVFSNFSFTPTANGGATPLTASQVNYFTVDQGTASTGFQFTFSNLTVVGTQSNDVLLTYLVSMASGFGPTISSGHADFTGGASNGGAASVVENLYIGCTGPCSSIPGVQAQKNFTLNQPNGASSFDYVWYPASLGNEPGILVSSVYVTKDINVIANGGFASISQVKNTVDQIPEPMTMALFGSGLLILGITRYRRKG